ncbi:hypothetical protein FACS1894172_19400 [Spirochaetia bacterium]|nr:hypothetical protein FACS1894172_19400 [Spirochaetia bacterium]
MPPWMAALLQKISDFISPNVPVVYDGFAVCDKGNRRFPATAKLWRKPKPAIAGAA